MKLTNATEKALAVIAMLATQKDNISISSEIIISRLELSPSYTKKLLRKLVVGNIIDSVSGNGGGFKLKKELTKINLLEIIEAIEGEIITYPDYGTLRHAFVEFNEEVESAEAIVKDFFLEADEKYRETMKNYTLDIVLTKIFNGRKIEIDWNEIKH